MHTTAGIHKSSSEGSIVRYSKPVDISHVVPSSQIKLGQAIEKGSFGVVRRARWLRAIVAVKILPTIKSSEMAAFVKEMSYACGLRHPHIVATMGAVTTPYCALIMELMPWGSLKASLNDTRRREHYDFKKMIRGMMSICRAGAYLASVYVIHRDISSKNVFVNAGFESMKLGDFGYSSLLEHHILDRQDPEYGKRLTDHMYIFAGAPAYKAPELLCSKPLYSEASDVFAFAIVCWEMITTLWSGTYGRPWSDINNEAAMQAAILSGTRPPIDPEFYGVPEEVWKECDGLVEVIRQSWSAKPKDRPSFLKAHDRICELTESHVLSKPLNDPVV